MYLFLLLVVWQVLLLNTNSDYLKSLFSSLKSRYCTQNVSMSQPIKWFSQFGTSLVYFSLCFSPSDTVFSLGWRDQLLSLDCRFTIPHQHQLARYNTKSLSLLSSSLSLPYRFRRFFGFFLLGTGLGNDFDKFLEEEVEDDDDAWTGIFFLSEAKRWWWREDLGVWWLWPVLCWEKINNALGHIKLIHVFIFSS